MVSLRGVVTFFNSEKGYGFIDVGKEKDLFVHQNDVVSNIGRDLVEGDVLSFGVEARAKGEQAVGVKVVSAFDVGGNGVRDYSGDDYYHQNRLAGESVESEPGIFIPVSPKSAAKVIIQYFDDSQIEELTDCLLGGCNR